MLPAFIDRILRVWLPYEDYVGQIWHDNCLAITQLRLRQIILGGWRVRQDEVELEI
jgi:hypothetical protein